ncbi:MAG: type II secretion system protein [Planctomycetota bacterium]|jgi:prepilin-type processing-associated H-X9-DG protein
MGTARHRRHGVTLTELLVVIAGIAVLIGLLFPALAGFRRNALMAESMSNLKQIAASMRLYSGENREFIVPSQFNYDYTGDQYRGKVRAPVDPDGNPVAPNQGERHKGTWTDILWTVNDLGPLPEMVQTSGFGTATPHDYRFDSPDAAVYERIPSYKGNVLRSVAPNSRDFRGGDGIPKPFGTGAAEASLPGFFAANNFFNADPESPTFNNCTGSQNGFWTTGQIKAPDRSMYLVDSFAGETIEDDPEPFLAAPGPVGTGGTTPTLEVDFRYSGVCLMLFLDGHVAAIGPWDDICDLEGPGGRGIRIRDLANRSSPCPAAP